MTGLKAVLAGCGAVLLAAGGAQAQSQELSEQEVQTFLSDAEQTLAEAARSADFAQILDWTKQRIADDATFTIGMNIFAGETRKGYVSLTLTKDDMVGLGGISAGVLSGMQKDAIEDYSLTMEMTGFTPIGPNAAMVTTEMTESGRIGIPAAGGSADAQSGTPADRAQAAGAAAMEATAQCSHIIQRAAGAKELQMGLTTCLADARLSMN